MKAAINLAAHTADRFVYYANRLPVIFNAQYVDNAQNRELKRVGKSHGFRQGVRNLAFVPVSDHPANPSAQPRNSAVKYYWLTRGKWRAFNADTLTIISAWFNPKTGQYVGTPEEAGVDKYPEFVALPAATPQRADAIATREARAATRRRFTQEQRARNAAARTNTSINRLARAAR